MLSDVIRRIVVVFALAVGLAACWPHGKDWECKDDSDCHSPFSSDLHCYKLSNDRLHRSVCLGYGQTSKGTIYNWTDIYIGVPIVVAIFIGVLIADRIRRKRAAAKSSTT